MPDQLIRLKYLFGSNAVAQKITGLTWALLLCTISVGQTSFHKPLLGNSYILEVNVWGREEGLPSWLIFSMITDRQGAKWFTSPKGLCRFDGQMFTNYEAATFGVAEFTYIYKEDKEHNLIMTGRQNYLNIHKLMIFSTTQKQLIPLREYITSGYDPHIEDEIHEVIGNGNTLYVKSKKGILWRLKDRALYPLTDTNGVYDTRQNATGPEYNNFSWQTIGDTLFRIDGTTKQKTVSYIWKEGQVCKYFSDHTDHLWGITINKQTNKLEYFKIDQNKYVIKSWEEYQRAAESSNISYGEITNIILFNQHGYNFSLLNKTLRIYYHGELLNIDLNQILKDHKLNLTRNYFIDNTDPEAVWIATQKGLVRITIRKNDFQIYESTKNLSIRGIYSENNEIIFNSYDGTFKMEDKPSAKITPLLSPAVLASNYPMGLLREGDSMWIGMGSSYTLTYNLRSGSLKKHLTSSGLDWQNACSAFQRMPDGQLYMGCALGLLKYEQQQDMFVGVGLESTQVNCFRLSDGILWLGTKNGLFKLQNGIITEAGEQMLSDLSISNIYIDRKNNFWLSTNRGLVKWHPENKTLQKYINHQGLSHTNIHAVYPDKVNNFWGISDDGLFYFDTENSTFTTFGEDHGLPNSECNFLAHTQNREGRLYFGTLNGIFSFHPDNINPNQISKINNLSILDITVNGTKEERSIFSTWQKNQGELEIGARANQINIYLSAPYYGSDEIIYQWRIPGTLDTWQYSKSNKISLLKLPAGQHILELRASTPTSKPSEIIQVPLYIQAPLTQRWWFIALILTLVAGLARIGVLLRLRRIRQQNNLLEQEVIKRTSKISAQHAQILEQEKTLRQLDHAKIRFFENINHELRTPITILGGYIRKLVHDNEFISDNNLKIINLMEQNIKQLKDMSEEMLEYARLDSGKAPVIWISNRWKDFLQQTVSNFSNYAAAKKINLNLIIEENTPEVLAIPQKKVGRIINNLIENALKFTQPDGRITVYNRVTADTVQIIVSDTGIGVPETELQNIFERFYRSDRTTNKAGFGIGLSLCYEYAALIGGKIEVQSVEGEGSTFTFTFPRKDGLVSTTDVGVDASKAIIAQIPNPQHATQHRSLPHLLIVEDNPDMQAYLWDILHTNYHISTAYNGHQALQILKQPHSIDLVITDIMMPGMDGYELLSAMRADDKLKLMPTIILTALTDTENINEGLRLGVNTYLTKPFSEEELAVRIQNLLQFKSIRQNTYAESAILPSTDNTSQNPEGSKAVEFTQIEDELIPAYDEVWIQELEAIVKRHLDQPGLKIESLANEMYISERTFRNKIKLYTGLSPAEYLMNARLNRALYLLESRRYGTISEVCYAVGLKNPSHFTRAFRQAFGKLPSDYFKK